MTTPQLTLTRNELLVVLQIMGASTINGLEANPLDGLSEREIEERMNSGLETLLQRGLIEAGPEENALVLKDMLVAYVGSCIIPEKALLLSEVDTAGVSKPVYFNATDHLLIEHASPRVGIHEFTQYVTAAEATLRLQTLLGHVYHLPGTTAPTSYTTADQLMAEVLKAARTQQGAAATQTLVNAQWQVAHAQAFVADCAVGSVWTGILGQGLRDPKTVTSQTVMLVAGPERCWLLEPTTAATDILSIAAISGRTCEQRVLDLLAPLTKVAALN